MVERERQRGRDGREREKSSFYYFIGLYVRIKNEMLIVEYIVKQVGKIDKISF